MKSKTSNCKKLDANYFVDYHHLKKKHHLEFLKDKKIMLMENKMEKNDGQ